MVKTCRICKCKFDDNPFIYCNKCMDDGSRVATILQKVIEQLTSKLRKRNKQVNDLREQLKTSEGACKMHISIIDRAIKEGFNQ